MRQTLTPMELRVLTLTALGLTTGEIAHRLSYQPSTVKNYLAALNQICGTSTRTAMVIESMRRGYIPCPLGCRAGHPPKRKPRPRRR